MAVYNYLPATDAVDAEDTSVLFSPSWEFTADSALKAWLYNATTGALIQEITPLVLDAEEQTVSATITAPGVDAVARLFRAEPLVNAWDPNNDEYISVRDLVDVLTRLSWSAQQMEEVLRAPASSTIRWHMKPVWAADGFEVPGPTTRASSILGFDSGGDPEMLTIGEDLQAWSATLDELGALETLGVAGKFILGLETYAEIRIELGLVVGTNVQAYNAGLAAIAALTTTAYGRSLLTLADAGALQAELDVYTQDEVVALIAGVDPPDISAFGLTLLDDEDAATARATLGLTIGTNVQAQNATLATLAGITLGATGQALLDDATPGVARTTLGLGSLATAESVNNTNWIGADLAVTNGGTGASDAATARTNLEVYSEGEVDALLEARLPRVADLTAEVGAHTYVDANSGKTIVATPGGPEDSEHTIPTGLTAGWQVAVVAADASYGVILVAGSGVTLISEDGPYIPPGRTAYLLHVGSDVFYASGHLDAAP